MNNVELEIRPPDQQTRTKPDIIIHDDILMKDERSTKSCKAFLDTIIYDIFRKEHKISIEKYNHRTFSARHLRELEKMRKHENKFEN